MALPLVVLTCMLSRRSLQAALFPSSFYSRDPTETLEPGQTRLHVALKILVEIRKELKIRLPTKEPSKVDQPCTHIYTHSHSNLFRCLLELALRRCRRFRANQTWITAIRLARRSSRRKFYRGLRNGHGRTRARLREYAAIAFGHDLYVV